MSKGFETASPPEPPPKQALPAKEPGELVFMGL